MTDRLNVAVIADFDDSYAPHLATNAAVPTTNFLTEKKIAEIVDGLGNVAELLDSADPSELAALYAALRLEMVYNAAAKIVGVSIRPTGRGSNRVRGGT
jgi:hypothetical protein